MIKLRKNLELEVQHLIICNLLNYQSFIYSKSKTEFDSKKSIVLHSFLLRNLDHSLSHNLFKDSYLFWSCWNRGNFLLKCGRIEEIGRKTSSCLWSLLLARVLKFPKVTRELTKYLSVEYRKNFFTWKWSCS